MWMKGGSLKLNTLSNLIKYSEVRVRLKYGLCGIKIWINYGNNNRNLSPRNLSLIYPIYIPFKYTVEKKNNNITLYYIRGLSNNIIYTFKYNRHNTISMHLKVMNTTMRAIQNRTKHLIPDDNHLHSF